jgi:proteasome component ECM29
VSFSFSAYNMLLTDIAGDRHGLVAAEIFHAISKHAPERFAALGETMLSYVFIGKHDDREDIKEIFRETWSESTSGPRVIILHLKTMMQLAESMLENPRWRLKHASARAVSEATEVVSDMDKLVSPEHAPVVWPPLVKALNGKSWEGKEVVLNAFVRIVEDVRPFWEQNSLWSEIQKVNRCHVEVVADVNRHFRSYFAKPDVRIARISSIRTLHWGRLQASDQT